MSLSITKEAIRNLLEKKRLELGLRFYLTYQFVQCVCVALLTQREMFGNWRSNKIQENGTHQLLHYHLVMSSVLLEEQEKVK